MNATDTATPETAEQRYARRRADPLAHSVAVEMAAQAYATWHGWDWPSLSDYYGVAESFDASAQELRRIEQRQRVRHIARIMVDEYDRSLQFGGRDGVAERQRATAITEQHAHDTTRRLMLKPKPPISSILTPRTGD